MNICDFFSLVNKLFQLQINIGWSKINVFNLLQHYALYIYSKLYILYILQKVVYVFFFKRPFLFHPGGSVSPGEGAVCERGPMVRPHSALPRRPTPPPPSRCAEEQNLHQQTPLRPPPPPPPSMMHYELVCLLDQTWAKYLKVFYIIIPI